VFFQKWSRICWGNRKKLGTKFGTTPAKQLGTHKETIHIQKLGKTDAGLLSANRKGLFKDSPEMGKEGDGQNKLSTKKRKKYAVLVWGRPRVKNRAFQKKKTKGEKLKDQQKPSREEKPQAVIWGVFKPPLQRVHVPQKKEKVAQGRCISRWCRKKERSS